MLRIMARHVHRHVRNPMATRGKPPGKNSAKKRGKVIKGTMHARYHHQEPVESSVDALLRRKDAFSGDLAAVQNYRSRSGHMSG